MIHQGQKNKMTGHENDEGEDGTHTAHRCPSAQTADFIQSRWSSSLDLCFPTFSTQTRRLLRGGFFRRRHDAGFRIIWIVDSGRGEGGITGVWSRRGQVTSTLKPERSSVLFIVQLCADSFVVTSVGQKRRKDLEPEDLNVRKKEEKCALRSSLFSLTETGVQVHVWVSEMC